MEPPSEGAAALCCVNNRSPLAGSDDVLKSGSCLKKAAGWPVQIEPPPEFQDVPAVCQVGQGWLQKFARQLVSVLLGEALVSASQLAWSPHQSGLEACGKPRRRDSGTRLCWTPELPFSPGHHRPGSRGSLASSRLSISHNSLAVASCKADDSSFITLAMSHDVLVGDTPISDIYNVPFDSDIYAVPIDVVRPCAQPRPPASAPLRPKRKPHRKKKRHVSSSSETDRSCSRHVAARNNRASADTLEGSKRHSVAGTCLNRRPGPSECSGSREPIHMTLQEVRHYLQNLYSSSSDSSERKTEPPPPSTPHSRPNSEPKTPNPSSSNNARRTKKSTFIANMKNKRSKESSTHSDDKPVRKCSSFSASLKQTLCSIFRFRKMASPELDTDVDVKVIEQPPTPAAPLPCGVLANGCALVPGGSPQQARAPFSRRALPPLPASSPAPSTEQVEEADVVVEELSMDFASSIEKVKDYGWYWGPISGEAAEKILSSEPDGSFIVRDSSDHHYIFSLTFRLNGCVRHVRIEHDQGNFSFGSCTKFKSHTIVDFIENAVEHSRSGRYLFFLHRRPVLGPMRVQLLHPVSRFKQVQSLQHMCRFVILRLVRRDLISTLPLPRRVLDYLSTPHYYAEQQLDEAEGTPSSAASSSGGSHSDLLSFVPHRPRS